MATQNSLSYTFNSVHLPDIQAGKTSFFFSWHFLLLYSKDSPDLVLSFHTVVS